MKSFLYKARAALSRFMIGRHGVDQFGIALLYTAIALNFLALIPYLGVLALVSMATYVFAIFRIFSKNNVKRYAENAWYLRKFGQIPTRCKQAWVRFKNRKQYLYFDCPNCHAKLRLPRGVGEVTVTCGKCGHAVRKTA